MTAAEVTEKILAESEESIELWACKNMDCKARGPMGNAVYRQLKKNDAAAETYRWLTDDLKLKFRQTWAMERNFNFISQKRLRSLTQTVKREEIGTWKSQLQLEVHFGGAEHEEAKRQAQNYINNCELYKDRFDKWT